MSEIDAKKSSIKQTWRIRKQTKWCCIKPCLPPALIHQPYHCLLTETLPARQTSLHPNHYLHQPTYSSYNVLFIYLISTLFTYLLPFLSGIPTTAEVLSGVPPARTLPARFADGLDVDVHGHALLRAPLSAVEGRHHDHVALLPLVAQPLRVPDVSCDTV